MHSKKTMEEVKIEMREYYAVIKDITRPSYLCGGTYKERCAYLEKYAKGKANKHLDVNYAYKCCFSLDGIIVMQGSCLDNLECSSKEMIDIMREIGYYIMDLNQSCRVLFCEKGAGDNNAMLKYLRVESVSKYIRFSDYEHINISPLSANSTQILEEETSTIVVYDISIDDKDYYSKVEKVCKHILRLTKHRILYIYFCEINII